MNEEKKKRGSVWSTTDASPIDDVIRTADLMFRREQAREEYVLNYVHKKYGFKIDASGGCVLVIPDKNTNVNLIRREE